MGAKTEALVYAAYAVLILVYAYFVGIFDMKSYSSVKVVSTAVFAGITFLGLMLIFNMRDTLRAESRGINEPLNVRVIDGKEADEEKEVVKPSA
jgi:uncharacterized membrane protein YhiD involved in acid resistance